MPSVAITNIGCLLSGDLNQPIVDNADTVICRDDQVEAIGRSLQEQVSAADRVLDAHGSTVAPGLIDSHCHVVLGDYTPRQKTVDFLDSYVHGGITSAISPGEIHAPGRPRDAAGVKALAIAARACFLNFHPNGMRVHAGAVVLEPTLQEEDFADLQRAGVWLAKFGFGNYADPLDGIPQVRWAQKYGLNVMCHSGGASIPGSKPITAEHLLELRPNVCGHANGGPTALTDAGVDKLVTETDMVLQMVQAGNIRSMVRIVKRAQEAKQLHRIIVGSDTPTGTGVMPLGVLKTVTEMATLTGLDPAICWTLATGNNAHAYGLNSGRIAVGADADLVVMDAPWGSVGGTALEAIANGDVPGISAVVIEGVVRTLRSRNTPAAARMATVTPPMEHLAGGH